MEELEEGRVIGSYRIVRCIGQGGMGTVYEVEHIELGVHYAMKTYTFDPTNGANKALKTKFLEEGKVLARLKHPNIAHVFDLAADEQTQTLYFVMDLVVYTDGESYTVEDVEPTDIDEDTVYDWFKDVASALDYIHSEGIVHRDIKPGNLLIDKNFHTVLTDFGISRVFGKKMKDEVDAAKTMYTTTGRGKLIVGTEKYIAPEVAHGEDASPAADAYALGVMLLRWLTGFYYGDNPGALELLAKKKYRWSKVIPKLLARNPELRPKTYMDLVRQLKPQPQSAEKKAAIKKKKRNNILKYTAITSALSLLVIGFFVWAISRIVAHYKIPETPTFKEIAKKTNQVEQVSLATAKVDSPKAVKIEKPISPKSVQPPPRLVPTPEPEKPPEMPQIVQKAETNAPSPSKRMEIVKSDDVPKTKPSNEVKSSAKVASESPEDFGPIPNVRYAWNSTGTKTVPLRVDFKLANDATINLMPMKKGSFFMSNLRNDVHVNHKVTFTYDYWMTKHLVTAQQWRDYAPFDAEASRKVEAAVKGKYPVCLRFTYDAITNYCNFMTCKYRSQIPTGYVFRLPTEAELEYAEVGDGTLRDIASDYRKSWGKYISGFNEFDPQYCIGHTRFKQLVKECNLEELGRWQRTGLVDTEVRIMGLAQPFVSGVYDCWEINTLIADRFATHDPLGRVTQGLYVDEEIDPLKDCDDKTIISFRDYSRYRISLRLESGTDWKSRQIRDRKYLFRMVLAPALDKLRTEQVSSSVKTKSADQLTRKYNWSVPRKLSHPKEVDFKLANGENITFCACPAGRFLMSNIDGQARQKHRVTITRPFWMSKYAVTAAQFRDFGRYDCEGSYRVAEEIIKDRKLKRLVCVNNPIVDCMPAFFHYLNTTYGHQIPKGYVFRLPSEAELEYAMKSGGDDFPREADVNATLTAEALKRVFKNDPRCARFEMGCNDAISSIGIGRLSNITRWGFYDLTMCHSVCDEGFFDGIGNGETHSSAAKKCINYKNEMIDPCGWTSNDNKIRCQLIRQGRSTRMLIAEIPWGVIRVVIGPDLMGEKNNSMGIGKTNSVDGVITKTEQILKPVDFKAEPPMVNKEMVRMGNVAVDKGNLWTFKLSQNAKMDFIKCPAGTYTMGYKKDEIKYDGAAANTPHKVSITRHFWLSQYRLNNGQWLALMGGKPEEGAGWQQVAVWDKKAEKADRFIKILNEKFGQYLPAGYVFRLPSEAEWEYALKANVNNAKDPHVQYWISQSDVDKIIVPSFFYHRKEPKASNQWGLYDMLGEISEVMLDTIPVKDAAIVEKVGDSLKKLVYPKTINDPVFNYHGDDAEHVCRGLVASQKGNKLVCKDTYHTIRVCIGPDILVEDVEHGKQ